MTKTATLVSVSRADDNSYHALADISTIIADRQAVVIGGHMVQLLLVAYPTEGTMPRRTVDADAGLTQLVATSGEIHHGLAAWIRGSTRRRDPLLRNHVDGTALASLIRTLVRP